eukprot:scaffold7998_cov417-Prasinococcus_capsulatus_cf.AAC.5
MLTTVIGLAQPNASGVCSDLGAWPLPRIESHVSTIGMDFKIKTIVLGEKVGRPHWFCDRHRNQSITGKLCSYLSPAACRQSNCRSGTLQDKSASGPSQVAITAEHLADAAFTLIRAAVLVCWLGIIVVYSITDRESFENVKKWLSDIDRFAAPDVNKLLVGNKSDLASARQVEEAEGRELAKSLGIPFIETSAKSAHGVEQAFMTMAKDITGRMAAQPAVSGPAQPTVLSEDFTSSLVRPLHVYCRPQYHVHEPE